MQRTTKRTLVIFMLAVILGFIISLLNLYPARLLDSAPVVEEKIELTAGPTCTATTRHCPQWTPSQHVRAWRDGRVGPKQVRVPQVVERAIRKAVNRKSERFQRQVRNMPWFQRQVWRVNCFTAIGTRQFMPYQSKEFYPKCLTPRQMKNRFAKVHQVYVDCSQSAVVVGGVGAAFEPRKKNVVVGMLGGAVGCMADKAVSAARDDSKWVKGYLSEVSDVVGLGFKSLSVVAAEKLGY